MAVVAADTVPIRTADARLALYGRLSSQTATDAAAARRATVVQPGEPVCIVNGRFYGQTITGVQRYGREIVAALDAVLAGRGASARLALPRGVKAPAMRAVAALPPSRWQGHVWEQAALPGVAALPLLNLCNTGPVLRRHQVVCLHDVNVLTQPDSYRPSFRLFYRALQPLLARRAAVLATVSQASAADIAQSFGVDRRRIAILPNGHEHALRWQADHTVLRRWNHRRPFVLLLGSRARHKNAALLLRLAPALDAAGVDLVVAGGGGGVFAAELGGEVAGGNVHWLGPVSDGDLAGLLAHALCLAFPSLTEGFGLPIVEAMARGCPVVASDRASMPEVCGTAALLAAPDDPAAWLAAITTLHRSADLRADLVGRGAERMRRFSWEASARGYLDLLERLA